MLVGVVSVEKQTGRGGELVGVVSVETGFAAFTRHSPRAVIRQELFSKPLPTSDSMSVVDRYEV